MNKLIRKKHLQLDGRRDEGIEQKAMEAEKGLHWCMVQKGMKHEFKGSKRPLRMRKTPNTPDDTIKNKW